MSKSMDNYRHLEKQLIWMRWKNQGLEDPGEEALLEQMTEAWRHLDDEEQATIRKEGPKTLVVPTEEGSPTLDVQASLDDKGLRRHYTGAA